MPSEEPEHFCTLFDSNFLPQGLALYRSLEKWAGPFRLWILCMDERVEGQLTSLGLKYVEVLPLREVETEALLSIKQGRSKGEYCWTLTPFLFPAVFARAPSVSRVTYLDADLYFFGPPAVLLGELDESGKDVLITEHAYDAAYDQSAKSGRFCVQFLACNNSAAAAEVYTWWAERCLDWCFNRYEEGRFGDQKYLDSWPERFGRQVHVLGQRRLTLGPWNVGGLGKPESDPVLYHYHSLRIVSPNEVKLFDGYKLGAGAWRYYDAYMERLGSVKKELAAAGIPMAILPDPPRGFARLRRRKREWAGTVRYAPLA